MRAVDLVLVGGGTAGALLAARLLQVTDARLLLLEAGPPFPRWALGVPLASYRLSGPWAWPYQTVPQMALNGRRIRYPMGRVLGGSSSVNAMIVAPGPPADYDAWRASGCEGWGWADLEPHWQRATRPGQDAAVAVAPPAFTAPFTRALIQACGEYGLVEVDPLTGEASGTCGRFALFQRGRLRYSTALVLAEARRTGRLLVRTGRPVRRILFERDRAVAVECGQGRSAEVVRAASGVVLCAGVFGSPAILMRSGIGPAERIRAAGLVPRLDLPGVGANLQDHIGVPVIVGSRAPSPGRKSRWLPAAIRYALTRSGVMASNGCEGGAFLGPAGQPPALEIAAMFQTAHRPKAVEIAAIVMHPQSRGWISLDPRCPEGAPIINPCFLSAPADGQALREGIDHIRAIVAQPSLRAFGLTTECLPGDADGHAHIRSHASTHFHPVGTCRMGADAMAVVTADLAVRGVRQLWVCDASIIPHLPAGHSAATAMLIGQRGADLIARQCMAGRQGGAGDG